MTLGPLTPIAGPAAPPQDDAAAARAARVRDAATQFEALLIRQLVQVMRSTVGGEGGGMFGSGAGSQMYAHLFDQNLADSMAAAGGMGMRSVIERSMLGDAYRDVVPPQSAGTPLRPFIARTVSPIIETRPASGAALGGRTGLLQGAAIEMLGPSGFAAQWGYEGRLTREDLASNFSTVGPEGRAAVNVEDAAGFEDCYKCNLFAFELARRAGFVVPLIGRGRGWGYMGPPGIMADAASGRMRENWGQVATGESAESLDSAITSGERAFLLSGSGWGDRRGHVGVVERVHQVDYDDQGQIRRIVFDGWEGRIRGAQHLTRRTWNAHGTRGGEGARGGFERIEIVELQRPDAGQPEERPLHRNAHASVHDLVGRTFSSSPAEIDPMASLEEAVR